MAYAGARGATASEMARVLHYTLPPDRLHPAMGALLAAVNAPHKGFELHVADALWAQQDASFWSYLNLIGSDYSAGFRQVDFKSSPDGVRATINQWIAQQTNDRIKDMLQPGTVTPATRLVLTNAIYFKGSWHDPFNKKSTQDEAFHVSSSQSVQAPFMHRTGRYRYYDGGNFQALELPYEETNCPWSCCCRRKPTACRARARFTAAAAANGSRSFNLWIRWSLPCRASP